MSQPVTVASFRRATKYRAARAMHNRHCALAKTLGERNEQADLALDPGLMLLQAEHDQQVASAVQRYRHAGGRVLDHVIDLPEGVYNDRPEANAALQVMLRFKAVPSDAARIDLESEAGSPRCYFDGRHREAVMVFLKNYYRQDEWVFDVKPLPVDSWMIPDLPNDLAATAFLEQLPESPAPEMDFGR